MYRGFNLKISSLSEEYMSKGILIQSENTREIITGLKKQIEIDGSKLQDDWFPAIDADVFVSHSHDDGDLAICLSGFLAKEFGLKVFVDHTLWGNSDTLLRVLDNEFCKNEGGHTYDYQKRNRTTSHVHMMLSVALCKMIDKAECMFFLNTPSSVTLKDNVTKTSSPWIYSEIVTSEIIRKKTPLRLLKRQTKVFNKAIQDELNEDIAIKYNVDLSHLKTIDLNTLQEWERTNFATGADSLDTLYELCP